MAFVNEDEFAYGLLKEPGHTAIRREVIYVIDCIPVPIYKRQTLVSQTYL